MKYFTIGEVSQQLKISKRKVYHLINSIENETPHQFGRMFCGNYYRAKERKEKVVSERDLLILMKMLQLLVEDEKQSLNDVIEKSFGVIKST
jgi:hypothetical protein